MPGATATVDVSLLPFLTAWDPSDLPGGSIDPLGFDRGYGCLADKLLPGLTNVAHQPRYFGLICAGASCESATTSPSRIDVQARQDAILRLERYWTLANVLAARDDGPSASGIRGVTYAEAQRKTLEQKKQRSTGSHFTLLSRQVQYGVVGIYGHVAHGLHLLDRKTLGLTTGFGETLGRAFLEETQAPKSLRAAITDADREVGLDALRLWGEKAHLTRRPGVEEARILGAALQLDTVRGRTATALWQHPPQSGESELRRLRRIAGKLGRDDQDLVEAIEAILAYETCFGLAILLFERILWCSSAVGAVSLAELAADEVIQRCARDIPGEVARFEGAVDGATTSEFKRELERLRDVRTFLVELSQAASTLGGAVEQVIRRHTDVQRGKFDHGRRKLPWIEVTNGNAVLTLARAKQVSHEPRQPDDLPPHEYRTAAADALNRAARGARP